MSLFLLPTTLEYGKPGLHAAPVRNNRYVTQRGHRHIPMKTRAIRVRMDFGMLCNFSSQDENLGGFAECVGEGSTNVEAEVSRVHATHRLQ